MQDFDGVIVPGVGAFNYVMGRFRERGGPAIIADRPVFGICVGMQIMFEASTEKGKHSGLGIFTGDVEKLPAERLPHMGWTHVETSQTMSMFDGIENESFYFVHTYARLAAPPVRRLSTGENVETAIAATPTPFVATLQSGPLWGTQFHPEKSGHAGLHVLDNWLQQL